MLYRRGIHLLLRCAFSLKNSKKRQENTDEFQLSGTLRDILSKAQDCSKFLSSVTPPKITRTWNTCGPVFGTLHSLVSLYEEKREDGDPRPLCSMRHKFITFQLPSGKHLEIQYSRFFDGTWAYGNQEALKAVIDETKAIYNDRPGAGVLNWRSGNWKRDDKVAEAADVNCLNSIGKLLEEEIGEVAPSGLDGELIKEFAEGFPHFRYCSDKATNFENEEFNRLDKVSLRAQCIKKRQFVVSKVLKSMRKGIGTGERPFLEAENSSEASECSPEDDSTTLVSQNMSEAGELSAETLGDDEKSGRNECLDETAKVIREFAELVSILTMRGDSIRLKALTTAFGRFEAIEYNLRSLKPRGEFTIATKLFQSLLRRVKFDTFSGSWGPLDIADKYIECKMDFKLCSPYVLSFKSSSSTDGNSYPCYELEFNIPSLNVNLTYSFENAERNKSGHDLSCLGPVTAEIQKCIDIDCPKVETGVPYPEWPRYFVVPGPNNKITDKFVAAFFISLSEIDYAFPNEGMDEECMADENFFDSCSDSDFDPLTFEDSDSDETGDNNDFPDRGVLSDSVDTEMHTEATDSKQLTDIVHNEGADKLGIFQLKAISGQHETESSSSDSESEEEFEVFYSDDSSISDIEIDPEELNDIMKDKE